ncbi:MAG: hypothetical protein JW715_17245 [Sedimentisphaerales bacterium]|nr:hypothetical protein [Sedimentisphaerales bacterium]
MKAIFNYLLLLIISTGFITGGCTDQYGAYEQTTRKNKLVEDEVQRLLDMYRNGSIPQSNVNISKTRQENTSVPETKQENKSTSPLVEIQSDWMDDFLQTLLDKNEIKIKTINDLNIPIESRFEIKGHYGCIAPYPYNIIIHQRGQNVIITSIINRDRKKYHQDFDKFLIFWLIYSSIDINSLQESYGEMETTADFRGKLSINVTTQEGQQSKDVGILAGRLEDGDLAKLIKGMTWLVHGDGLVSCFFKQLWD